MKPTATIYINGSRGSEAIAQQREVCHQSANRLGFTVTQEYIDCRVAGGHSATSPDDSPTDNPSHRYG